MKFSPMMVERGSLSFDSITLDNGSTLAPVEVAYQTYGRLNAAKSNAILVEHAFSGDAHAAGKRLVHRHGTPPRELSGSRALHSLLGPVGRPWMRA